MTARASRISEVTRRDIFDSFSLGDTHWSGRLEPLAFLNRLFDLSSMPSTDSRFKSAEADIRQDTVNNDDWDADWVFTDFNLLCGGKLRPKPGCRQRGPGRAGQGAAGNIYVPGQRGCVKRQLLCYVYAFTRGVN